jgi:hypothetical protein
MRRNLHRQRLDVLEQAMLPKGRLLVFSSEAEIADLDAKPRDIIIVTGVPRALQAAPSPGKNKPCPNS